jgi:hypothetical protein
MSIRALALVIALAAAAASPAAAYCPSIPDDSSTGYVENSTARALCLQRELARDAELAAQRAEIEARLRDLQLDLQRQQLTFAQPVLPVWPTP